MLETTVNIILCTHKLREKCQYSELSLRIQYLSVFSPNAGKYGPQKLSIWTLFTQWQWSKSVRNKLLLKFGYSHRTNVFILFNENLKKRKIQVKNEELIHENLINRNWCAFASRYPCFLLNSVSLQKCRGSFFFYNHIFCYYYWNNHESLFLQLPFECLQLEKKLLTPNVIPRV